MRTLISNSCLFSPLFIIACLRFPSIRANTNGNATIEQHIIFQGCNETKPDAFWVSLKEGLVQGKIDFNSVICVATDDEESSAVKSILRRKNAKPNTVINVVASLLQKEHCEAKEKCNDVNNGENYISLLRSGVKGYFIENGPNFEALNVSRTYENITSIEIFPDNANAGRQIGRKFCLVAHDIAPANIVVLYGPPEANHSTERIQNFIDELEKSCPKDNHTIGHEYYANWNSNEAAKIMGPLYLRDSSIDAVIAANDGMALGALVAAEEIIPDKKILVAGFNADSFTKLLLKSGDMFATVNLNPPSGLMHETLLMLSKKYGGLDDFESSSKCSDSSGLICNLDDYNSIAKSTWEKVATDLPTRISTRVTIQVKDPSVQIRRELLQFYNRKALPHVVTEKQKYKNTVQVTAAIQDFQIYGLDAVTESTSGQGLMVLSWEDTRLRWSKKGYPDVHNIHISVEEIWHPVIVLGNLVESKSTFPLSTVETTVYSNGTVVWEQSINSGIFGCPSITETVLYFPYDSHKCGVDIKSYSHGGFTLEPSTRITPEKAFIVEVTSSDWIQGTIGVSRETENTSTADYETVHFTVAMERDPLFFELSYVIPVFILNVMSFAQFWVPTRSDQINFDRGGMSITTILSSLALRDSMASTVGTSFSLLDLYMLVSLLFQFVGFLITTYESSSKKLSRDNSKELQKKIDLVGRLILPLIFGVFNITLSIFWNRGARGFLFYMSVAEIVFFVIFVKKKRQFIEKTSEALRKGSLPGILFRTNKHTLDSISEKNKTNITHEEDKHNNNSVLELLEPYVEAMIDHKDQKVLDQEIGN